MAGKSGNPKHCLQDRPAVNGLLLAAPVGSRCGYNFASAQMPAQHESK